MGSENTPMGYACKRCAWTWETYRPGAPKVCPRCKSRYWNRERVKEWPAARRARQRLRTAAP